MHLTFRQLHYFAEIVEAGNMTKAAERLHVVPTALSVQVRAMEESLGVTLLQRHSRGVRPTSAGAELHSNGQKILAMLDETERAIAARAEPRARRLRVGVPPSVLRMVSIETVLAGEIGRGGVAFRLQEGFSNELIPRLAAGNFDCVLAYEVEPSAEIRSVELVEELLVLATAPTQALESRKISLAVALASELVIYGEENALTKCVFTAARTAGLCVNVAHSVGSIDVIRQMVRCGAATALVPYGVVEQEVRRGEIAVHEIVSPPIRCRMSLVWPERDDDSQDWLRVIEVLHGLVADIDARARPFARLLMKEAPAGAGAAE